MVSRTGSEPLWEFALALYSSPGVEETLLSLQDDAGANVNILLWACWLETCELALTTGLLTQAESAIAHWDREMVQVLRDLRRRAPKEGNPTLARMRNSLKDAELMAERHCLSLLSQVDTPTPSEGLALGSNLEMYLSTLPGKFDIRPIKAGLAALSKV